MNDDVLRAAYQRVAAARLPASRADCPSPDQLLAVVERHGSEIERLATANHAARCIDCRRDLDLLRAVHATKPNMLRRVTTIAAAAAILVVAGVSTINHFTRREPTAEALRGTGDVTLVSPRGDVPNALPLVFSWKASPTADQYEISVVADDGSIPVKQTTRDTTLSVPTLAANREYFWTVTAHLANGGERRSDPAKFRLVSR